MIQFLKMDDYDMTTTPAVSVELLAVNNTSHLGVEVLGIVESLRTKFQGTEATMTLSDLEPLLQVITKSTHIKINAELIPNSFLAAIKFIDVLGHSGVSGRLQQHGLLSFEGTQYADRYLKGTIDLKNAKVGGDFKEIEYTLVLGDDLLLSSDYTPEEITAIILHEVGHAFWSMATIGEYVWLNYFLSEGIEVLQKRKPNKYRVEVLDIGYLTKHVTDDKLRDELRKQPTDGHLRKAILDVNYNYARGHLHSVSNPGSFKRHEQMADWFVSRLGFARPLATGLHKLQRMNAMSTRYYISRRQFVTIEVIKVLWGASSAALTVISGYGSFMLLAYVIKELIDNADYGDYDNPTERIRKLRLDLVSQLKDPSASSAKKDILQADIEIVDGLLKTMNQYMPLLTMLLHVFSPGSRRNNQLLKQEQTLEDLLNNDLFIFANKFR